MRCAYVGITRIFWWKWSSDIGKIHARKNQKLIITILDEFIDESSLKNGKKQSARGILSEYANPELQKAEESAWEKAVEEKYGNAWHKYHFALSAEW